MSHFLDQLRVWIEQIILTFGYPGITFVMFLENLFPPIPSEGVLLFGGFLVAQQRFSLAGLLLASTLGSVLGAVAIYAAAAAADERLLRRFMRRYGRLLNVSEHHLDQALQRFERHGEWIVLGGRILPLVRSLISVPAGLNRMPIGRFVLFTTLGSALWNTLLGVAGMLLGQHWTRILAFTERYEKGVVAAVAVLCLVWIIRQIAGRYGRGKGWRSTVARLWLQVRGFKWGRRTRAVEKPPA